MNGTPAVLVARGPVAPRQPQLPWPSHLHGSDLSWSIIFVIPYAALFAAFVIYPIGHGLWMGSDPALYSELLSDPRYIRAAINTVVFTGLAVNVQMILALLLSGVFMRRRRLEEARAEAAEVMRVNPKYTIKTQMHVSILKRSDDSEYLIDGLRKAGLPE